MKKVAIVWMLVVSVLAFGCEASSTCDEGYVLEGANCVPDSMSTGDASTMSDAGNAADASGDAEPTPNDGGDGEGAACFEETCASHDDCDCDADYCGIRPGESTGYCTYRGCKEDPSVCPESWSCMDLSIYQPTLPSICVRPD